MKDRLFLIEKSGLQTTLSTPILLYEGSFGLSQSSFLAGFRPRRNLRCHGPRVLEHRPDKRKSKPSPSKNNNDSKNDNNINDIVIVVLGGRRSYRGLGHTQNIPLSSPFLRSRLGEWFFSFFSEGLFFK